MSWTSTVFCVAAKLTAPLTAMSPVSSAVSAETVNWVGSPPTPTVFSSTVPCVAFRASVVAP